MKSLKFQLKTLPSLPGIYYFYDRQGQILYIGKASNLKNRVRGYFHKPGPRLIEQLIFKVAQIKIQTTASALEALFLEANEIKRLQPKYNQLAKDDKSFLGVIIINPKTTKLPLLKIVRDRDVKGKGQYFGPFVSGHELKVGLKLLRKIFPWCDHPDQGRPCFYHHLGLCPGICAGKISPREYRKIFRRIKLFLGGKIELLRVKLKKEMILASQAQNFELASQLKKQIFALTHIQDVALTFKDGPFKRTDLYKGPSFVVEGYDASHISGKYAVGVRVVFIDGRKAPQHYRKFKIRAMGMADDMAMLKEILARRIRHKDWIKPHLVVIDGGRPHLKAARQILGSSVKMVSIAKGVRRQRNDFYGERLSPELQKLAMAARDEAHRFSQKYFRQLLRQNFLKKNQ